MNLHALFGLLLDCHTARNEIRGVKTTLISALSAGKWMDQGHPETKGDERNIMKVSSWLIIKENRSRNKH